MDRAAHRARSLRLCDPDLRHDVPTPRRIEGGGDCRRRHRARRRARRSCSRFARRATSRSRPCTWLLLSLFALARAGVDGDCGDGCGVDGVAYGVAVFGYFIYAFKLPAVMFAVLAWPQPAGASAAARSAGGFRHGPWRVHRGDRLSDRLRTGGAGSSAASAACFGYIGADAARAWGDELVARLRGARGATPGTC